MVAHDWGDYESIATRIAQKTGQVQKVINELKGVKQAGGIIQDEAKLRNLSFHFSDQTKK